MAKRDLRGRLRRVVAAASGLLVGAALFPSSDAAVASRATEGFELATTVGLVRGPDADSSAERVVREALAGGGVRRVVATDGRDPGTDVTVWLGDGDAPLDDLGAEQAAGLAAEGYSLAAGKAPDGRAHVVLDGVDADGTFYAAEQLSREVVRLPGLDLVPAVRTRTAPAMRVRGVVEGFYGTPWSHDDRLDILGYLGEHRMNTYEYAPKDDPYLRDDWRQPFPTSRLADLGDLVRRAADNRVDFAVALSPGLSICYTSASDVAALTAKLDAVYAAGVRSFTLAFDDIDPGDRHCAGDRREYGDEADGAGRAQAELVNRIQREWAARKGDVGPLQLVPTEYDSITESPYKKAIREKLDPAVAVRWTGVAAISHSITRAQAAKARAVFGHDVVIWDNYPANDYIAGRLPLGPYTGREAGLSADVAGILSNPMNQAAPSTIALYSVAEFGWDDRTYDPTASWQSALAEQTGENKQAAWALGWFADLNSFDGTLHYGRAPALSVAVKEFWASWQDGQTAEAAAWLRPTIEALVDAPHLVRTAADPAFVADAKPWIDASDLWAQAMRDSLDAMVALADRDLATAWGHRQDAAALVAEAKAVRDTRAPHAGTRLLVGDGVADRFVADVARAVATDLGAGLDRPVARTSLTSYAGNTPARMLDGDRDTYFSSDAAPKVGDFVQVDLRRVRPIGEVSVDMAYASAPKDYLGSGVLEYSEDGATWNELGRGDSARVTATAPDGVRARFVRYRATAANAPYWLVVRAFDVEVLDATTLDVTGDLDPADDSSLSAAADDDLGTAYVASGTPEGGETLVVGLSTPRRVERVSVLQEAGGTAAGLVEVRINGAWSELGDLAGTFTELSVLGGAEIDAIRLTWEPGPVAPQVLEIVPRYLAP